MKFRRSAGARNWVLVRDAYNCLRQTARIDGWRAAARTVRRVEAKHWVVAGIGFTKDSCGPLGLFPRRRRETGFLGRDWPGQKKNAQRHDRYPNHSLKHHDSFRSLTARLQSFSSIHLRRGLTSSII